MEIEQMDVSNETVDENQEKAQLTFSLPPPPVVRVPVKHTNLGIRSHAIDPFVGSRTQTNLTMWSTLRSRDMSTMVELTSFSTLGKIQPFLVTISTNAALLVDLHCHLTDKEVCGYLGGHWDINSHTLSILGAFPCRYAGKDKSAAAAVETEIARAMEWNRMTLVGWYHSHPCTHASPSLRDVDSQLDYQIKMKGPSDNGYTPCVGLICSPYNADGNCYESNFNIFWSLPPPENRPHEYPRPMLLSYTLLQEHFLAQDALDEIKKCIEYYKLEGGIDFKATFSGNTTYLERLRSSLASKLPGRNRTNDSYWDVIREMICPGSEEGSSDAYIMKLPLVTEQLLHSSALNAAGNVFLAPVNFKSENTGTVASITKQFASSHQQGKDSSSETNSFKDSILKKHQAHLLHPDGIPTFRAGELTVSLKNSKNDYSYTPTDFSKNINPPTIDPGKSRSTDYPLADCLTQQMAKFPDLSKLANFSPSELAKLSGFSLNDFTNASSSSSYVRNIANLFGPLGNSSDDGSDRRMSDYPSMEAIQASFKVSSSSSPSQESGRTLAEDYSSERKKELGESLNYMMAEDFSVPNVKRSDFGSMLDMTTKKQHRHSDSGDMLNLSKDR